MLFSENPFYILGCELDDSKDVIHEKAEIKSFEIDEVLCRKAENALINPKIRLEAEVGWFLGWDSKTLVEKISRLALSQNFDKLKADDIDPRYALAEANLICYAFEEFKDKIKKLNDFKLERLVLLLCDFAEKITVELVEDLIVVAREKAGVSTNISYKDIKVHIEQQKNKYGKTIYAALESRGKYFLADSLTKITEQATQVGTEDCQLSVLEQILSDYEIAVQAELESIKERIKELYSRAVYKILPDRDRHRELKPWCFDLDSCMTSWYGLIRPVILLKKTYGLEEEQSKELFYNINNIVLVANNIYHNHNFALKVTLLCKKYFSLMDKILTLIEESEEILRFTANRVIAKYSWGLLLKESVELTIDSIIINGKTYYYDDITAIRCDFLDFRRITSYNPDCFEREYFFEFQYKHSERVKVPIKDEDMYHSLRDSLYESVVLPIGRDFIEKLKRGKSIYFDGINLYNDGIELKSGLLIKDTKKVLWKDISFAELVRRKIGEESLGSSLKSYAINLAIKQYSLFNAGLLDSYYELQIRGKEDYSLDFKLFEIDNAIVLADMIEIFFEQRQGDLMTEALDDIWRRRL